MATELDITFRKTRPTDLVTAARRLVEERPALQLTVRHATVHAEFETIWGRFLPDREAWDEAREEQASGLGQIEVIGTPDGSVLDVFLYDNPYRHLVLAALRRTGTPRFEHVAQLTELELGWSPAVPPLCLSLDAATNATARLIERRDGVQLLETTDGYTLPAGAGHDLRHHMTAVHLLDALAAAGELHLFDSTGYAEHRDPFAVPAAAAERHLVLNLFAPAAIDAAKAA